ncbi:sarcosine oxidase subunit delta [Acetobacteraceae bacterium H6797]|nr:sarcosine oxidase subunit delta [Acetobacteraceae bacterium H6797]
MRINCPCCGERGPEEFSYLGDASLRRPAPEASEAEWADYVYLRENPSGRFRELWYHSAGCHAWLVVERDLRTHEIFSVEFARDVAMKGGAA